MINHLRTSVVISTYNGMAYIKDQLDSIKNQSEQPDEVLIFDDCSSDGTFEFVKQYIIDNSLSTWTARQNEKNKGWALNFWDGIRETSGDIIFTCDQDDYWQRDKILVSKTYMNNQNIGVLVSNYESFFENGKLQLGHEVRKNNPFPIKMNTSFFDVSYPGCVYCFRKSFYNQISSWWKVDYPHDAMLWRYGMLCDALYGINEPLIKWRKHRESTFAKESRLGKTRTKKIEWIRYANSFANDMIDFSQKNKVSIENIECISVFKTWLEKRYKFLNDRQLSMGIKLLPDLNMYHSLKRYMGDWYLLIMNK